MLEKICIRKNWHFVLINGYSRVFGKSVEKRKIINLHLEYYLHSSIIYISVNTTGVAVQEQQTG